MDAQEVADGVHVSTSGGLVNWVLVVTDDGLLAHDAGLRTAWEDLVRLCARLARDPAELRGVLLTHGHVDHTGFARRAQEALGAPVHVHSADVRVLPRLIARASVRSSADARASLEMLERVDADVLVPGHGPVWTGGVAEAACRARDAVQG